MPTNPPLSGSRPVSATLRHPAGVPAPRLVLFAEQPLVGEAVRVALMSRGFELAGVDWSAGSLAQTRRRIATLRPQAGLLVGEFADDRLRERAVGLISAVRVQWLLLANDPLDVSWGVLLAAGVANVRSTSIKLDTLVTMLNLLMTGREVMSKEERERRVRDWQRIEALRLLTAERVADLTPKELAVLSGLYEGHTVIEIATSAGVSQGTVRSQVKAVLRKLGVNSQIAAVAAFRQTQ